MDIQQKANDFFNGSEPSFKYQMLSRLQFDCDYYLGNANKNIKVLWALNVADHINLMLALYDLFDDSNRPEWITREDILNYKKQMEV